MLLLLSTSSLHSTIVVGFLTITTILSNKQVYAKALGPVSIHIMNDTTIRRSAADSAWVELFDIIKRNPVVGRSIESIIAKEQRNVKFRNMGLKFWEQFPQDIRKFRWLELTIDAGKFPYYWKNITEGAERYVKNSTSAQVNNLDFLALRSWEKRFRSLRKEYYNNGHLSGKNKKKFRRIELLNFVHTMQNVAYRRSPKLDLNRLTELFVHSATDYWKNEESEKYSFAQPLKSIEVIFLCPELFGLNCDDLLKFLRQVENNATSDKMMKWVDAKRRYIYIYIQNRLS